MSLNGSLKGLRLILANPHHVELGVLAVIFLIAMIWIELRKSEPWIEWLAWSVLVPPFMLYMFDMRGEGLDTSPIALGVALLTGVGGGGLVALRGAARRRRLDGLREIPAPNRHMPLNLGNG
ncbi:hypothetical protein ASD21_03115 [Caulobacter sp. Root1455]|uniref:hypothetical protein n=1 Tax=unclassified Caulobacter TaxID=2648921 RepID=UPI0006F9500D|nr:MULTISPECIES: hypothetical protein [unclassified Caulobacter]KQY28807.1 hypothetical protein ASD38_14270 [Caulobacter sp. Root487D2Y]KQY98964.1 hypothetical protein ASD21_03115 [Caulobacter sp. Root1455]